MSLSKFIVSALIISASGNLFAANRVCQFNGQVMNEVIFLTVNFDDQNVNSLELRSNKNGISHLSTINDVKKMGTLTRYVGELFTQSGQTESFELLARENSTSFFRLQRPLSAAIQFALACK